MTSLFCWHQHFHLVTSSHFSWNLVYYSRNRNFWTTYRIRMVDPSFESTKGDFSKKGCLGGLYGTNFADVSIFSVDLEPTIWKIRDVTSLCQIFIKFSENISFLDILLVTKFEVICIIWRKVMNISVISGFIWKNIGNLQENPITFLLCLISCPNFDRVCLIDKY